MRWRVSEHGIFHGTLRIARFDFDTDPSKEYREELYFNMETKLNALDRPAERKMFEAAAALVNHQTLADIQALAEEEQGNGSRELRNAASPDESDQEKPAVAGDRPYFDYH